MGKLFGTDGIRGQSNQEPLTPQTITRLGLAIAAFLQKQASRETGAPKSPNAASPSKLEVLIGEDTRLSSPMVASALTAGLCAAGVNVLHAGVLPTPAVAYLTSFYSFAAGIVISASHNPFEDNGIKLFNAKGGKLATAQEEAIAEEFLQAALATKGKSALLAPAAEIGTLRHCPQVADAYQKFAVAAYPSSKMIGGGQVILDCANGATNIIAPAVFSALGVPVLSIHDAPDGKNINAACGSQHTESLAHAILSNHAVCGFAFDGDGDRVIAVDEQGKSLSGDQILTICGLWLKSKGKLKNNTIVRTVMSNQGMTNALREHNIDFIITDVGDKFVAEAMATSGATLGGEDSGHIILGELLPTGDGILTALHILAVMAEENKPLSDLAKLMEVLPQALINIPTKTRRDFNEIPEIARVIAEAETELGKTGRLLVRYSGTQNLCRVMVEAPHAEQAQALCQKVANIIAANLV